MHFAFLYPYTFLRTSCVCLFASYWSTCFFSLSTSKLCRYCAAIPCLFYSTNSFSHSTFSRSLIVVFHSILFICKYPRSKSVPTLPLFCSFINWSIDHVAFIRTNASMLINLAITDAYSTSKKDSFQWGMMMPHSVTHWLMVWNKRNYLQPRGVMLFIRVS